MAADFTDEWENTMENFNLICMPHHIMVKITAYFSYAETAELRKVCQLFNSVCKMRLTDGFRKVDQYHSQIHKHVKSQLPRRESERHNHALARHVNILSAVETRLSLLSMTFTKYIDSDLCCFIPGKVLDELFSILRTLQCTSVKPPRAHEFLQELRDISSMAMEHFDESIVPILKQKLPGPSTSFNIPDTMLVEDALDSISSSPGHRIRLIHNSRSESPLPFPPMNAMIKSLKKGLSDSKGKINEQRKMITEQDKKIADLTARLDRQDTKLGDMTQKMLLCDKKFTDIFTALPKLKNWTEASRTGLDFNLDSNISNISKQVPVSKKPVRISKRKRSNLPEDEPTTSTSKVNLRKRTKKNNQQ